MKTIQKESFYGLGKKQKLQYIWDYYKLPMAAACIAVYIVIYIIYGHYTHQDISLYTALVNVNAGEDLTEQLSSGFLKSQNIDTAKNKLNLYSGLYLTNDENNIYHEYTYASRMKILATIDSRQLDVVIMDKEAFDAFSQNDYLYSLDSLLSKEDPTLYEKLKPFLVKNIAILEDNSIDLALDNSLTYKAITEEHYMGLDLSASAVIQDAGFGETLYLGIIKNTPRKNVVIKYLKYLFC